MEKPSAGSTVEPQLAPKLSKADSVAPKLRRFMAMKRAKHEKNAQSLCVGFVL
jgi:hypothetical protein